MAKTNPIEVQKALKDVNYPANRDQLVDRAKKNGAGDDLVNKIAHLKRDEYTGPNEVEKEIFK
jgi:hypothetical protein